jgi:hypothetical protein
MNKTKIKDAEIGRIPEDENINGIMDKNGYNAFLVEIKERLNTKP